MISRRAGRCRVVHLVAGALLATTLAACSEPEVESQDKNREYRRLCALFASPPGEVEDEYFLDIADKANGLGPETALQRRIVAGMAESARLDPATANFDAAAERLGEDCREVGRLTR